ncbi:hypothetical protein PC129_g17958 [Phytophthora cactorum]|uniref:Uncharacterized protein n=1 Tax=Phytophthora cactorum TaxID=29920 RepID=A0A8T1BMF9_9STRA|nr:hypothetical protein Pcac1_g26865 [Phytophthora cactorum]KAG2803168.1 hypothetical protein PC112_g19296 [Phytophthora cactorum]KAG2882470.1 hypothetical protein PC114_g21022 [Phytophthora cactorum]KAG2904977.1 hypothetical protein PC117_g20861 [Phytophthora cactorum]KAG3001852.1 hypothetical protein PC120_g20030 [Phytophthora cactorum]
MELDFFAEETDSRRQEPRNELVLLAWRRSFQRDDPDNDAERAVYQRLLTLVAEHEDSDEAALTSILLREVSAKMQYLDHEWGFVDASNIVSRVDECIIALQEQPKKHFLDPLSWDMPPHKAVVSVVEAVLLLFDVPLPSKLSDEDTWRACWGLWIVKNIEAHSSGWEWLAHNEPIGLFTKPYALSVSNLDRVCELLQITRQLASPEHRCWHHLPAYAFLRDWAGACAAYLHMVEHCLPEFDGYEAVQKLVTPPKRTPKENVWFCCESEDGIAYFYNRLYQSITLDRPQDFDGAHIAQKNIPSVIQELIVDTLQADVSTRLELERRGKQKIQAQLLDQDQWVECFDTRTQTNYYYSIIHYRFSVSKLRTVVAA